jgi:hypothetical protein
MSRCKSQLGSRVARRLRTLPQPVLTQALGKCRSDGQHRLLRRAVLRRDVRLRWRNRRICLLCVPAHAGLDATEPQYSPVAFVCCCHFLALHASRTGLALHASRTGIIGGLPTRSCAAVVTESHRSNPDARRLTNVCVHRPAWLGRLLQWEVLSFGQRHVRLRLRDRRRRRMLCASFLSSELRVRAVQRLAAHNEHTRR